MLMHDVELLRAVCCVAGLDGEISSAERAIIDRLAEKCGVGAASLKAMLDMAVSNPEFYRQQFKLVQGGGDRIVATLLQTAIADKRFAKNERAVISHLARKIGVAPDRLSELLAKADEEVAKAGGQIG